MYWGYGFWGMSLFWWIFWIAVVILFFAFLVPVPRGRHVEYREPKETPLEILARRYAAGEITTPEYDERKARLERDLGPRPPEERPPEGRPPDRPRGRWQGQIPQPE
jgi:putative membrane protein